ncbi:hypothetical protein NH340_JMT08774 [Sarcoptes scabiei]|nr:hypothetical protein NH340_JMT08774 [Sarcoptes scabiei]
MKEEESRRRERFKNGDKQIDYINNLQIIERKKQNKILFRYSFRTSMRVQIKFFFFHCENNHYSLSLSRLDSILFSFLSMSIEFEKKLLYSCEKKNCNSIESSEKKTNTIESKFLDTKRIR